MDESYVGKTDEELAVLVRQGIKEAFEILMDRYQSKLLRYGRKFLANEDHVEDVVQDVFIKTYENIQSFDATRKFSPWIYRIAHNAFINAIRKRQHESFFHLSLDSLTVHPMYEFDPAEEEEKNDMQQLVRKGLKALSPLYSEVIILYYLENQGYQEIADILHVPVGTVGVRLRRAREALKTYVERE